MKKKFIIAISVILVFALLIGIDSIYNSQRFDYLRIEEIPKGYVDYDGRVDAGKDYSHYLWYKYNEMPELDDRYKRVGSNVEAVETAITDSLIALESEYYIDVSSSDYYILSSFNQNGEEMDEYNSENSWLFLYDVESNTLYNLRWIW